MINSVARSITSRATRAARRLLPGAGRAVLHLLQPETRTTDVKGDTSDREPLLTPGSCRRPRVSRIPYRRRYAPSLTPSERRHAIASGSGLGRSPWTNSSPPATRYMRADGCEPDPVTLAFHESRSLLELDHECGATPPTYLEERGSSGSSYLEFQIAAPPKSGRPACTGRLSSAHPSANRSLSSGLQLFLTALTPAAASLFACFHHGCPFALVRAPSLTGTAYS
jgi:hypothetical protein